MCAGVNCKPETLDVTIWRLIFSQKPMVMSTESGVPSLVVPTGNAPPYVPVQCRGMDLLGFAFGGSLAVCVHQLAVELWKRYDTPRVSLQKKIEELKLKLNHCNKEQIRIVRKASIIENFRATYLSLHDAEILCDALELSRKKRGLQRHPLKTTSADRGFRKEETRAKKMAFRQALMAEQCSQPVADSETPTVIDAISNEGALNRVMVAERGSPENTTESELHLQDDQQENQSSAEDDNSPHTALGTLLLVKDSYKLPEDKDCECRTVLVRNDFSVNPPDSREPSDPQRMDESSRSHLSTDSMHKSLDVVQQYWYIKPSVHESSESLSHALDSAKICPPTTLTLHRPVSRIRSPSFCSSGDLEDHSPQPAPSSRSHSNATSSSPERFLHLDSGDSDFESATVAVNSNQNNCSSGPSHYCHQYRGIPHKGKQLREIGGSCSSSGDLEDPRVCSSGNCSSVDEGGTTLPLTGHKQHRIVKATKLRHYAKTTSPSSIHGTFQQRKSRPTSLLVSISLSSLSATANTEVPTPNVTNVKPRKPTALSNFVTKKRALSRSPSVTNNPDTPTLSLSLDSPDENETRRKSRKAKPSTGGGKVERPPAKVGRPRGRPRLSTKIDTRPPPDINSSELCGSQDPSPVGQRLELVPDIVEDDQISIASSNTTTSSANSIVVSNKKTMVTQRGGRRQKHSRGGQNSLRIESNFSLESLFSYYPPTLIVKDGELVPEKSLSIKNLDRSSLPSSHPIDRWSLGQPVRGRWNGAGPKTKRPRKNTGKV